MSQQADDLGFGKTLRKRTQTERLRHSRLKSGSSVERNRGCLGDRATRRCASPAVISCDSPFRDELQGTGITGHSWCQSTSLRNRSLISFHPKTKLLSIRRSLPKKELTPSLPPQDPVGSEGQRRMVRSPVPRGCGRVALSGRRGHQGCGAAESSVRPVRCRAGPTMPDWVGVRNECRCDILRKARTRQIIENGKVQR
jgi:hypothetical protein